MRILFNAEERTKKSNFHARGGLESSTNQAEALQGPDYKHYKHYKPEQPRGGSAMVGSNRGGNAREGIVHGERRNARGEKRQGELPGGEVS